MKPWLEIRPIAETAGAANNTAPELTPREEKATMPNAGEKMTPREAEKAAWHAIVREKIGPDVAVAYNDAGAPILKNHEGFIGVSHTRGWVAVVWSDAPCAVDIELKTRKISPAIAERLEIEPTIEAWCAWEAAYKFRSLSGHDPNSGTIRFEPHPELVVAVIV